MYCHKCGKKLDDGTRFCPDCGTELTPGASAEEKPVTVTPRTERKQTHDKRIREKGNLSGLQKQESASHQRRPQRYADKGRGIFRHKGLPRVSAFRSVRVIVRQPKT